MALGAALAFGCSGGDDNPNGESDAGSIDSGRPRFLCPPAEPPPACVDAADCQDDGSKPQRCESPVHCLPYNAGTCVFGSCEHPEALLGGDVHTLLFDVADIGIRLQSFAGLVIAGETSGGQELGCDDVYQGFDLSNPCVNVLDARSAFSEEGGTLYGMSFSRFASGIRALIVVFGFQELEARGSPTGVSCTEVQVDSPGSGAKRIGGDRMRPIQ